VRVNGNTVNGRIGTTYPSSTASSSRERTPAELIRRTHCPSTATTVDYPLLIYFDTSYLPVRTMRR